MSLPSGESQEVCRLDPWITMFGEHLNGRLKKTMRQLQSNVKQSTMQRAYGIVDDICGAFNKLLGVSADSTKHSTPHDKDFKQVLHQLTECSKDDCMNVEGQFLAGVYTPDFLEGVWDDDSGDSFKENEEPVVSKPPPKKRKKKADQETFKIDAVSSLVLSGTKQSTETSFVLSSANSSLPSNNMCPPTVTPVISTATDYVSPCSTGFNPDGILEAPSTCSSFGQDIDLPVTPLHQPVAPVQQPITPVQQPVAPVPQAVTPVQQPVTPAQQPITPVHQPVAPVHQPSTPVNQPVTPVHQPVALVQQPITHVHQPVAPVQQPITPVHQPVAPIQQPITPV
ncbi:PREDICTED: pollen-specific leucine-rich repeat extensin-like protein 4 [Amphimedon queenslandica]|uniref:Uncharacterized protein n=2 Tax=Amphimedon queenslandica TaxID=400682 RepID=A0AAN0IMK6_AMPQE|nr:PREDICTED: pollen-specific leucine-rich repeat extensin-like protein 4 [Amphimedon queenslandica]|eukprot:XP_011404498.1 PREDICTED: pollen-specific leucine-rich repeat extensin-like protein 4 [Amphimedon queenslandica]